MTGHKARPKSGDKIINDVGVKAIRLGRVGIGRRRQHIAEPGPPVARGGRKVGARQ